MNIAGDRHLHRSELTYALAVLGAHLAFMPLFVLLLPRRVAALAGAGSVGLLSNLLLIGGLAASIAHIAAGAVSDRWFTRFGNRRGLIAIGLTALLLAYALLATAMSPRALILAIPIFQLALNLMFAPLGAVLSDHVEDARKGRVAALMNVALPVSGLGTAAVAFAFPRDGLGGFAAIAAFSALAIAPLLLAWPFDHTKTSSPVLAEGSPPLRRADYGLVWGARLLIQIGAAFLLNYFFLFVAERAADGAELASRTMGFLAATATAVSVVGALGAGFVSDLYKSRRAPMIAGTLTVAVAFALLAVGRVWPLWMSGYVLFNLGLTIFLSIDSAMVAQLVARNPRRGELLGYMNLTNTLPTILVPGLAMSALGGAHGFDWDAGFTASMILAIAAAALVARIRSVL